MRQRDSIFLKLVTSYLQQKFNKTNWDNKKLLLEIAELSFNFNIQWRHCWKHWSGPKNEYIKNKNWQKWTTSVFFLFTDFYSYLFFVIFSWIQLRKKINVESIGSSSSDDEMGTSSNIPIVITHHQKAT